MQKYTKYFSNKSFSSFMNELLGLGDSSIFRKITTGIYLVYSRLSLKFINSICNNGERYDKYNKFF